MRRLWTKFLPVLPITVVVVSSVAGSVMGSLVGDRAIAASPQDVMNQLDAASSRKDVKAVMQFYSPNFSNSDGLNTQSLEKSLTQLWQQYPNLTYRTEVKSATPVSTGMQVETTTYVTGKQERNGQQWTITSTLRARQRFQGDRIVRQEILAEQTVLTLGEKPPTVKINLPETVVVGQKFNFEAIVQEPVGDDFLMGTIVSETVQPTLFASQKTMQIEFPSIAELLSERELNRPQSTPPTVQRLKLQRLRAGGFFKQAQAAKMPETRWISAVLARHDAGITIATQRLRVVGKSEANRTASLPNL
ncbi:nuclear transport factor 2 family protein [Alkalinema sp. FACHB-956]|uniref:nuclear transport factor 2 family protein n=1 Tax=Alkalinema sp. FACHB-956 TaxID=2692768 RepID=UPI001686CE8B|nr:nuclear transport factor 2 family protein [Alkalinema sp. FACHB-956]MBD2329968.1 nuclear transport factor 2 family protein [Alkalinema sp. FACHB-956]